MKSGERVIIAAHGNSLRALVKYLDNMSEEEILELNIPTGVPLVYEFDENFKPLKRYYLGNADGSQRKQRRLQTVVKRSKRHSFVMRKPTASESAFLLLTMEHIA